MRGKDRIGLVPLLVEYTANLGWTASTETGFDEQWQRTETHLQLAQEFADENRASEAMKILDELLGEITLTVVAR